MSSSEERVGGVEPETVEARIAKSISQMYVLHAGVPAGMDPYEPVDPVALVEHVLHEAGFRSVEEELRLERDLRRRAEETRENANAVSLRVEGENRRLSEELRQAREERNEIAGLYNAMQSAREQLTEERDRAVGEVFDTRDSLDAAEADRDRLAEALRKVSSAHHANMRPSKLHDPENLSIEECPCLTCKAAVAALSPVQGEHEQDGGRWSAANCESCCKLGRPCGVHMRPGGQREGARTMTLHLPIKLNDDYTCQGRDARGESVVFDDLLREGEKVADRSDGHGNVWGPFHRVVRREDGLWVVAAQDGDTEETT